VPRLRTEAGWRSGAALWWVAAAWNLSHAAPPTASTAAPELAALGRQIFFDRSLSASGQLACASCHDPRYAYGPPPGGALALGGPKLNQVGTRAVPSLRYLQTLPVFSEQTHFNDGDVGPGGGLTWDGRAANLHEQAQVPLLAANEMANASSEAVVAKLRRSSYAADFRRQFGADVFAQPKAAFADALLALEAFQKIPEEFFPYSSKYDAFLRGDADLTPAEERGVALFKDPLKGNCASCHSIVLRNGAFPTFSDFDYMDAGVPRNPAILANANPKYFDLGLAGPARTDLQDKKQFCAFFRAPSLRNTALRDAYFHNGMFHSLREVLKFYVDRDLHPENWYPRAADGTVQRYNDLPAACGDNVDHDPPLDRKPGDAPALSDAEMDDLVAFLETLTDGYPTSPSAQTPQPWKPPAAGTALTASDEYAWQLFVALNWPAAPKDGANASPSLSQDAPAAWERWQNVNAIFLADGRDPGPWRMGANDQSAAARFDTHRLTPSVPSMHIVKGTMVAFDPIADADRATETRFNRAAYDYIRTMGLFNLDGQLALFRRGTIPQFPADALEVKAQWQPISAAEQSHYHTLTVTLKNGRLRLYGLTALHIASKTLPNWFWATFEHVDAAEGVTRPQGVQVDGPWRYYQLRGTLTRYVDANGQPVVLGNSKLEAGVEHSSSCMTCHSRASIGVNAGKATRLPILNSSGKPVGGDASLGFVGLPERSWYFSDTAAEPTRRYLPLDFVWSLAKAQPRSKP
jgi:cytochrome c peroxidase